MEVKKKDVVKMSVFLGLTIFGLHIHDGLSIILMFCFLYGNISQKFTISTIMLIIYSALRLCNSIIVNIGPCYLLGYRLSILTGLFVLFSCLKRSAVKTSFRFLSFIYIYIIYMTFISLFGWSPIISELKIMLFISFFMTLHFVFLAGVTRLINISILRASMFTISIFYIIGTMISIPFPAVSKSMLLQGGRRGNIERTNEDLLEIEGLFNGLLYHSQTLGAFMAMLNGFLLSDYIFNVQKKSWSYRILLLCIPIVIYLSSSRTGMGAYIISWIVCLGFAWRSSEVSIKSKQQIQFFSCVAVIGLLCLAVIKQKNVQKFLLKGSGDDLTFVEGLTNSRIGLIESAMSNFFDSPLFGNGFQVSKDFAMQEISIWTAPIEKGNLFTMVLEEGGIIGGAIFYTGVLYLLFNVLKAKYYCFSVCFIVFLTSNLGEAVFFSTSGPGGFYWVLCVVALIFDNIRCHERVLSRQWSSI